MSFHRYHALAFAVVASMQQTTFAQSSNYNLPSAPLSQTMAQIARQNGVSLSANPELLKAKIAPAIQGDYNVDTAFNLALAGSGLQLVKNSDGTVYSLKKLEQQEKSQVRDVGQLKKIDVTALKSSKNNATQLPIITVNAEKDGSAKDGYLVKKITGVGLWGERDLQDTPYSMTVISQDLIENNIAKDMNQMFKMNPLTQEAGNDFISAGDTQTATIRGFNIVNPIVNGISYPSQSTSTPITQDIEKLEIISGTTGFLYGGGRVGGAINYVTKKPTIEDLRNVSMGSYGDHSYFTNTDISGQFDSNHIFGYRLNAGYQNGELPDTKDTKQKALSAIVDWKPNDSFYADLAYTYKDYLTKGANLYIYSIDDRNSIKHNNISNPDWLVDQLQSNKFESSIKWKINDIFNLRIASFYENMKQRNGSSGINYQNDKINVLPDYEGASGYINATGGWGVNKSYGGNFFLDGNFNIAQTQHTLTAGYSMSQTRYSRPSDNYGYFRRELLNITPEQFKHLEEPQSWTDWDGNPTTVGTLPLQLQNSNKFTNILLGDDIKFNHQWSALMGGNYASIGSWSKWEGTYNKSAFTPTLSIIYKPIEYLTTYATYIESLEAGTIVGEQYLNAHQVLNPYISKQYEIGAKYMPYDQVLFTSAFFRIEKANQFVDYSTQPKPTLTEKGQEVHQGIEFTLTGKVTDHLSLVTGGTLMDLSLNNVDDESIKHKKPINAASKMAKLYAEYAVPQFEGLILSAGVYYTGKKYADSINSDILPSNTLYDAGIRYNTNINSHPTTFNLTVQNIRDKVYWIYGDQLGMPRTVAFSIKTQF